MKALEFEWLQSRAISRRRLLIKFVFENGGVATRRRFSSRINGLTQEPGIIANRTILVIDAAARASASAFGALVRIDRVAKTQERFRRPLQARIDRSLTAIDQSLVAPVFVRTILPIRDQRIRQVKLVGWRVLTATQHHRIRAPNDDSSRGYGHSQVLIYLVLIPFT
jgi:hypothetical protein